MTHAAASAAHASTATIAATFQTRGLGGADGGSEAHLAAMFPAITPPPTPMTTVVPRTAYSVKPPKVPSASLIHTRPATPSTISASRAGAPDQPGSNRPRTRY